MTVSELIEELRKYPGHTDVWMFVDDVRYRIDVIEENSIKPKLAKCPELQFTVIDLVAE